MRKNLLVATLAGLCVIGLTSCSKGEENKTTEQNPPATAMTEPSNTEQLQAAPGQTADNSQPAEQNIAPMIQPEANQVVAAGTDNNQPTAAPDTASSTSMPASSTSMPASSTSMPASSTSMPASSTSMPASSTSMPASSTESTTTNPTAAPGMNSAPEKSSTTTEPGTAGSTAPATK